MVASSPSILLIAPSCDGSDVGEAKSAYGWVSRIAEKCDVTVLSYRKPGCQPLGDQLPHARVIEWEDLPLVSRCERFNSMARPGYVKFHFKARRWIRQSLKRGERFDLIHQVSPLALRYPSPGAGWNVPFIMGPIGGSVSTPSAFQSECGSDRWYTRLRGIDSWRLRHDPLLRRTYESAEIVIGVAPYVGELLSHLQIKRFEWMSEVGLDSVAESVTPRNIGRSQDGPLRLLYVGRCVRSKGLRDAVRAMSSLGKGRFILDAVGDGPDLASCEEEARRLGVGDSIRFHGRQPREVVDQFYGSADIFLFPSFREPSGNVIWEALSHGLPVITSDRGGPGFVVDSTCGVCVAVDNPDQFARALAEAIRSLAKDEERRECMRSGAFARVRSQGLWSAKIDRLMEIYDSVAKSDGSLEAHATRDGVQSV